MPTAPGQMFTASQMNELFKRVYGPGLTKLFALQAKTFSLCKPKFRPTSGGVGGDPGNWYRALYITPGQGIGARGEDGELPTSQTEQIVQGVVGPKFNYVTFKISRPALIASRTDTGAFASAQTLEVKNKTAAFLQDMNRQILGDGSGIIGRTQGVTTTSVTGDYAGVSSNVHTFNVQDARLFKRGMYVDVYGWNSTTNALGALLDADSKTNKIGYINSVDYKNNRIQVYHTGGSISSSLSSLNHLLFTREDNGCTKFHPTTGAAIYPDASASKGSKEIMGWSGVADDGTTVAQIAGQSRLDIPELCAWVYSTPGTFDDKKLVEMAHSIEQNVDGKLDLLVMSYGVERAIFSFLKEARQFQNPSRYLAGYSGIDIALGNNVVTYVKDKDLAKGRILGLNFNAVELLELAPFGFVDDDGAMLSRIDNKDAFSAYAAWYGNMFPLNPAGTGRYDGITEA